MDVMPRKGGGSARPMAELWWGGVIEASGRAGLRLECILDFIEITWFQNGETAC